MAIFHMSVKMVSRSKGQSAVAKAAYNARDKLTNEQTGERHDYHRHKGLMFSGLFVPEGVPIWAHDRQGLWSAVERKETRKNSQLAREIEVSLPHELTHEQRQWLVQDFVREQFTRRGIVADVAIHAPDRKGDDRNYHAHILLTTRVMTPEGFGAKARDLDSREQLAQWREQWEHLANRHLERHGHAVRIDHRSLEAQGIDREPTQHLGPDVVEMERKGQATDRGDQAREIAERNSQRVTLQAELGDVDRELQALALERSQGDTTPAPTLNKSLAAFHAYFGPQQTEALEASHEAAPSTAGTPRGESTVGDRVEDMAATTEQGLMVASAIAGRAASGLLDVVSHFLDVFAGQPPPRKISSSDMLRSAEARKAYSAQQRAGEHRDKALDRLNVQIKKGQPLEHAAIGALSTSDLQRIKDQGDDGLRALVRQREAEHQRSHSGGRTRER